MIPITTSSSMRLKARGWDTLAGLERTACMIYEGTTGHLDYLLSI